MLEKVVLLLFLGITSWEDFRERKISVFWFLLFGGMGLLLQLQRGEVVRIFSGCAIAAGLFLASKILRQEIGMGDVGAVAVTGIYLGGLENMDLLTGALVFLCVFSFVLLVFLRRSKDTQIPFLPFLLLSYVRMIL